MMELLKMSNDITKEEIIKKRKIEIDNYIRALKSLLCLRKLILEKLSGEFYFGSKLNYKNPKGRDPQTPDYIVKLTDSVWVGEIKKSLPNPEKFKSEEEYIKKIIEQKLMLQLKKYDEPFKEVESDEHDIVLMVPSRDVEAVGILKVKYLEKQPEDEKFKNNFAIIVYSIEPGANSTEFIIIKLDYGVIRNKDAFDALRMGYKKMLGEIKDDLAKYKIYEETDKTPIEYVMTLLWTDIFPEIIEKGNVEKIIEWRNKKEHIFEVKLDKLIEYLHKMYTLPSLNENDKRQFSTKLITDAMKMFSKIQLKNERTGQLEPAVTIEDRDSMTFKVIYKNFREKNELKYILNALYSKKEVIKEVEKKEPDLFQKSLSDYKD
jgi:hypothetical protein